mgnify:FL=1
MFNVLQVIDFVQSVKRETFFTKNIKMFAGKQMFHMKHLKL